MKLGTIRPGDVVEIEKRGSTFYAIAGKVDDAGLRLSPISRQINHFHATAREVVGHWRATKATRERNGWHQR